MNSRSKGARGERELAEKLREYGYTTRRGQQYSGANGDADVVGVEGLHIECKRVEKLTELMGKEAFEDWLAPVGEKAATRAMAEVSMARRIAEDKTGTTFTKVFGEEESFS